MPDDVCAPDPGDPACLLGAVCPDCGAVPAPAIGHGCAACLPGPTLAEVVACTDAVAATASRTAKTEALAALLRRTPAADRPSVVGLLVGEPRQGRIGVGWAGAFGTVVAPAADATLTVREVDAALEQLARTSGPGSAEVRRRILDDLFGRATGREGDLLRRLLVGELRHGALAGVVTDAVARADGVPLAVVRRAAMLLGDLGAAAEVSRAGGAAGLEHVGLQVGRAVQPMLASPAADVPAAMEAMGEVSVEWKLDGIRIQVHTWPEGVRVFTRNGNDITARVPEVVAVARSLPVRTAVLDGEAMGWTGHDDTAVPVPFQDTMGRVGRLAGGEPDADTSWALAVRPFFFDLLHLDGRDLMDEPLGARIDALHAIAAAHCVVGHRTADPDVVASVARDALAAGHEGVVVKSLRSTYDAGRRGKLWRKLKPVHTFDLVVLAVEWGHGRRTGSLSNLHLGARGADGRFVMVGKTFKGLTDALLAWQTERFLALETHRTASTVFVRPEQVVEIAIDGVQVSRRYPGGVALRFARVVRYRPDKAAADADTIESLQALSPR